MISLQLLLAIALQITVLQAHRWVPDPEVCTLVLINFRSFSSQL